MKLLPIRIPIYISLSLSIDSILILVEMFKSVSPPGKVKDVVFDHHQHCCQSVLEYTCISRWKSKPLEVSKDKLFRKMLSYSIANNEIIKGSNKLKATLNTLILIYTVLSKSTEGVVHFVVSFCGSTNHICMSCWWSCLIAQQNN